MSTRQVAVVAVLAVACVAGLALPAAGATPTVTPDDGGNETDGGDAGLGTQISAFMQSSAAQTNDTVESGMWSAAFEEANESRQVRLAKNRTPKLSQRLDRLRERNESLQARYENGSLSEQAYTAQVSRIAARIEALEDSVDDAERVAGRDHLGGTEHDRLRRAVRNESGAVPGVAKGLVTGERGPPADVPAPDHAGPPERTGAPRDGNETAVPGRNGPADAANATAKPKAPGVDDRGNSNRPRGNSDTGETDEDGDARASPRKGESGGSEGVAANATGNGNDDRRHTPRSDQSAVRNGSGESASSGGNGGRNSDAGRNGGSDAADSSDERDPDDSSDGNDAGPKGKPDDPGNAGR